jgi:hypothetical protein
MIKAGMFARNYWAPIVVLGLAFFLTGCGDLGMVLPSQGSYRVNAQVDGDYTLDAYSVVAKNSKIRPFFVNSVVNDPDVRGLTVFVQDYSGVIVSRKVHYQIAADAGGAQKPADSPELPVAPPSPAAPGTETGQDDIPEEVSPEEPPEDGTGNAPPAGEGSDEAQGEIPADSFGGAEGAGSAGNTLDEAEANTGGEADAAYASDAAGDFTDAGAADTGSGNTDAAGTGIVDTNTAGTDFTDTNTAGSDAADTVATGRDNAGADAADTDAVGRDSAGADAVDTDAVGQDSAGADAANTDAAGTETDIVDTGASTDTDTAGASAGDTEIPDKTGTETVGTETAVPPAPPAETPSAPIPEDEIVQVKQLDQYLPAFRIVEELAIGRYNLVFQVMGEKEILYKTYKPIYFIGDAQFTLGEIQSFLPVAITGGRLIPPGINVMLGTEISADSRLDPYIVWHNGKKIIAQGRLSGGANYLLWKTPEQTGFHSIRAEVFPLLPEDRMPGNMLGKIKELSLPVSSKSEGLRRFSDPSGEFINWYQLWGTLDDAKAPGNSGRRLISLYAQPPRWIPFGGMYGLLVGADDIYTLPEMPFKLSGDAQGTGRILFHFAALSAGSILNIRFAGGEAPARAEDQDAEASLPMGTADLDLAFTGDALILRIASGSASREESLELDSEEANSFITVVVEFTIAQDHLDAELRLENPAGTTGPLSIALAAPISGDGALRFGSSDYSGYKRSAKQPVSGEAGKYSGTMILNELALSYVRLPFPKSGEEIESGLPEALTAAEAYPGAEPNLPAPNTL